MVLDLQQIAEYQNNGNQYIIWEVNDQNDCVERAAMEYRTLRSQFLANIEEISVEGIGVFDTSQIQDLLTLATIPEPRGGNFDVVRSDFGEILAYIVLEQEYHTEIGYKLVRDRELIQLPGRGIDVIGVENGDRVVILFGEVKVSAETRSPPQIVDQSNDSISRSLHDHMNNHRLTYRKIVDTARKTMNIDIFEKLMAAALYWENEMWSEFDVICCGALIRQRNKLGERDFGLLKENPEYVSPAKVRFFIVCVDGDIDTLVSEFHRIATDLTEEI